MQPSGSEYPSETAKVISPFAQTQAVVSEKGSSNGKMFLVIGIGLLLVVAGAIAGIYALRFVNDPYRTLEAFPVAKYLDSYQGLVGSKLKAELHVEADLGWKDGAGRLMLFSTADDPRPIAVLIPVAVAKDIYFTKGQTYITEIEVKEGGLIYA